VQALVEAQHDAFNKNMIGRKVDVLFEKPGRHPGQIGGKSPYFQAVHVDGPQHLIGQIHPVEITATGSNSLYGRLISPRGTSEVMA
jgi:tRNA-2-methylthio-N6-dimethylallyladenosine synthase